MMRRMLVVMRCSLVGSRQRQIGWFEWLGPPFDQKQSRDAAADIVFDTRLILIET
jgi:hypothetical protein